MKTIPSKLAIYQVSLKTVDPVQLVHSRTRNTYDTKVELPSTTLRGALLTALMYQECRQTGDHFGDCGACDQQTQCPLFELVTGDKWTISSGYSTQGDVVTEVTRSPPSSPGNDPPVHPLDHQPVPTSALVLKCKRCKHVDATGLASWLTSPVTLRACPECKGLTTMASLQDTYSCNNEGCTQYFREPDTELATSVSINRRTMAREEQMLFNYEYISLGSTFGATLATWARDRALLSKLSRIEVGRGKSRGYGGIELTWTQLDTRAILLRNLARLEWFVVHHGKIPIVAKTPLVSIELSGGEGDGEGGFVFQPERLSLRATCERVIHLLDLDINIEALGASELPYLHSYADVELLEGWSYVENAPKTPLWGIRPGSVLAFGAEKLRDGDAVSETGALLLNLLSAGEFMGINRWAPLGYSLPYFPKIPNASTLSKASKAASPSISADAKKNPPVPSTDSSPPSSQGVA